jgi:hypothetical protein
MQAVAEYIAGMRTNMNPVVSAATPVAVVEAAANKK